MRECIKILNPAAGLYGNLVPTTVHNFLELMKAGTYNNTLFNKVAAAPGCHLNLCCFYSRRQAVVAQSILTLPYLPPSAPEIKNPVSYEFLEFRHD